MNEEETRELRSLIIAYGKAQVLMYIDAPNYRPETIKELDESERNIEQWCHNFRKDK